jgi:hypothetical protein
LTTIGTRYLFSHNTPSDGKHSIQALTESRQQALQQNSLEGQALEKTKQEPATASNLSTETSPKSSSDSPVDKVEYANEDPFVDYDLDDLPLPPIEFARARLLGWDLESEKLIEKKNIEGLVNLKINISSGLQKEKRTAFLKADSNINYLQWMLAQNDPSKKDSVANYFEQCKASLEALHKINPNDPFYFLRKSILALRHENDLAKAVDIAQQGLTLLRKHGDVTVADNFYDWKLTQIKAIYFSTSGKNQEAIKVINECKKRMEQLPEEERGFAKETSMVIDWLQSGKKFSNMVWNGKIKRN